MPPKNANGQHKNSIVFYTDPLCCWSWGIWPQWQQFLSSVNNRQVQVSYKMAGLLPSWKHFSDSVNAITKPVQMGPEWMHARAVSGVPIDDRIWIADPPASSYPACIAVKAASLQSPDAGQEYLHLVQKAVMTERRNIAKQQVLLDIAKDMTSLFDVRKFRTQLLGDKARDEFRKDLQEAKFLHIARLPTIIFKGARETSLISGYQKADQLTQAAQKAMPDLFSNVQTKDL